MIIIEEGDMLRVNPKDNYHKKEYKKYIGKIGKVVAIHSSYQAPNYYTLFFKDTQDHKSFDETEIELFKKVKNACFPDTKN